MNRFSRPLLALVLALFAGAALAASPQPGQAAPGFKLQDQNGKWQQLSDYRGQWVVLYFYPKDDTPGCTTEACNFRDDIFKFRKLGVQVLGISLDDVSSHQEFAEKYHLPFPILADSDHKAAEAYDVITHFLGFTVAHRETFIIAPDGKVAKHYGDVDPKEHSREVLAALQKLMQTDQGAGGTSTS